MKDRFPCRQWSSLWCTTLWDFQLWQADVVLVYLGTNDFHLGSPSGAEFQSAYVEFLMLVRSKYPQAMVLCIVPLLYSCSQESKWQTMLESLTEAVKGLEDKKVRLQFTGPPDAPWLDCNADFTDGIHLTALGHLKFAAELVPRLTAELRKLE
ncbi:unnamed protein product [Effrenium voratum]|nr:unnamed protein product [Effrenium voratum]CAJ1453944.1 unnamed protein product [Effrenium voratum]